MKANRLLILTVSLIFVLACSTSLGGGPTAVPPVVIPPTQAPLPTYTPYPTYTPVPSATLEPTAIATPTLAVKILPNTENIEIGKSVTGDTMQESKTWYFIGNQGDKVNITMSGIYPYFFLHDQDNKSLRGCDEAGPSGCVLIKFALPYTGVYYLTTEQREDVHWEWWGGTQPRFRGGSFTLIIEPQP
jgi:hypothetical protein